MENILHIHYKDKLVEAVQGESVFILGIIQDTCWGGGPARKHAHTDACMLVHTHTHTHTQLLGKMQTFFILKEGVCFGVNG
jgi:hypothetical protein